MSKPKLYFAHPVNTYGKPIEAKMLELIEIAFPQFEIENPNQPHHQIGYKKWKERTGNGMRYFYEVVLPNCEAGSVAMPFLDKKLGAGVAGEIIWYLKRNKKIFLISAPDLDWVRPFFKEEKDLLLQWDKLRNKSESVGNSLVLSIKDTRKRTWEVLYKEMRKYSEAHLV